MVTISNEQLGLLASAGVTLRSLALVPDQLREDAIQEACCAALQGRNARGALRSFRRRAGKVRVREQSGEMDTHVERAW